MAEGKAWYDYLFDSLGPIGNVAEGVFNIFSNKKNNETQKDIANQNIAQQNKVLSYNQELNKNQIQWQAADAQKAGINPLAMQGGSMQGGSYSNVSANTQPAQLSGIGDALQNLSQMYNQKKIADNTNETSKEVAESNNRTQIDLQKSQQEYQEKQAELDRQLELDKQQAELDFQAQQNALDRQQRLASEEDTSALEWNKYSDSREQKAYELNLQRLKYIDEHEKWLQDWYKNFINNYQSYQDDLTSAFNIGGEFGSDVNLGKLLQNKKMLELSGTLNVNISAIGRWLKAIGKDTSYEKFKSELESAIRSGEFNYSSDRYSRKYKD